MTYYNEQIHRKKLSQNTCESSQYANYHSLVIIRPYLYNNLHGLIGSIKTAFHRYILTHRRVIVKQKPYIYISVLKINSSKLDLK